MAKYPLEYKTEIVIQQTTLIVEPVRAPNTVHKWDRTLHIFMWVCACGKCGDWDGVKSNIKCNITISEHSVLQIEGTLTGPGRHWYAYFNICT